MACFDTMAERIARLAEKSPRGVVGIRIAGDDYTIIPVKIIDYGESFIEVQFTGKDKDLDSDEGDYGVYNPNQITFACLKW